MFLQWLHLSGLITDKSADNFDIDLPAGGTLDGILPFFQIKRVVNVPLSINVLFRSRDLPPSANDLDHQRKGMFNIAEINDTAWRVDITAWN